MKVRRKWRTLQAGITLCAIACAQAQAQALAQAETGGFAPEPLQTEHFADLKERSPFLRTLDFADAYRLRGVATIDGQPVAMLFNRHTERTVQVTAEKANELGMQLVGLEPATDLSKVSVRLTIGGEEVSLVYDEQQISPQAQAQSKPQARFDSKGRLQPPPTLVDKYRTMSDAQREQYQSWRRAYIEKHPDQEHSAERYQLGEKVVDAIKSGKGPPPVR